MKFISDYELGIIVLLILLFDLNAFIDVKNSNYNMIFLLSLFFILLDTYIFLDTNKDDYMSTLVIVFVCIVLILMIVL